MTADIFINISYKGAKFFYFYFFCQIQQSTKFQNITIFKVFFYLYKSFFFHWNSHILIINLQTLVVRGQVNFNYWIEEYILNDFKTFSFA